MTKTYNLDQHTFAIKQPFTLTHETLGKIHTIDHVEGFDGILKVLNIYKRSLTLDELFRIFIDNNASVHNIFFMDNIDTVEKECNIVGSIKIEKDV
ncbi:hypothetical protein NVP1101O_170 [Vibrio phage 1.101.O._10N.261.45.C6]|nr:hypothetical protein NVP1101O_170 [Vibrio phage 1.101.O._10N.261.45.C6]